MVLGSSPVAVTSPSDLAPASSKELLDIQATIECGFTLKRVRDMTNKILMLAKSKLSSIDILISQAITDMDISHEEFITILIEKDRHEMMQDNLRNKNGESYPIMRFKSVKSKI